MEVAVGTVLMLIVSVRLPVVLRGEDVRAVPVPL